MDAMGVLTLYEGRLIHGFWEPYNEYDAIMVYVIYIIFRFDILCKMKQSVSRRYETIVSGPA
jgi:hypothetical protein